MKRAGNLWDQITSLDNIVAAHHAARRGKFFPKQLRAPL
jgi:hypothetical protein